NRFCRLKFWRDSANTAKFSRFRRAALRRHYRGIIASVGIDDAAGVGGVAAFSKRTEQTEARFFCRRDSDFIGGVRHRSSAHGFYVVSRTDSCFEAVCYRRQFSFRLNRRLSLLEERS